MRYIWRFIRLTIFWPLFIVFYILAIIYFNFLSILWYFNLEHLKGFENFWYPVSTDQWEIGTTVGDGKITMHNSSYDEYYKTPMDCLLNRRHKIYRGKNDEANTE